MTHGDLAYLLVCGVGLLAGLLSGVVGTGSSIMLLPVLVFAFGPKQAVPIMAVAAVMSNLAKVMAWRREVDWRAFAAYSAGGIPAAALGARTLLVLPAHVVDVALGAFFLAMIPARRWLKARDFHIRLWQLALAGAAIGFITGIVVSTGPLSVPAFLAYGLTRGAFLSTEAMSSLVLYVAKVSTFRAFGALPLTVMLQGLIAGSSLMVGAFAGKAVVLRMSTDVFEHVLDAMLLVAGCALLWAAVA
ncbi:MAG: sulfite exporter TauE/SafE family protein [Stellaceae bacterium]